MENRYSIPQSREGASVDAGLRSYMQSVYNRMTVGVLLTALTSYIVSSSPELLKLFLGGPQAYIVMFAPLAILWFGFRPERMSSQKLMISFLAIAVLYGISFSVIALAFTGQSIARTFFVATAMFAGLSIYGYTSKKNLDALGAMAVMGVWGIFVAAILNLFFHSPLMQNVIAAIGIVAFSGVTAWQTQVTKQMYHPGAGAEINSRMGWAAALNLYISFIALFQYLIHFMVQRN